MTRIKSDRYLSKFKGYLTYPPDKIISGALLDYYYEYKFSIQFEESGILAQYIKKDLINMIEKDGGKVEKVGMLRSRGKSKLFDIPVEIRKIKKKNNFEGIRIRLTGDTKDEISQKIDIIKERLSEYGIKPKECIFEKDEKDKSEEVEIIEESIVTKFSNCPDCGSNDFDMIDTPRGMRFQCQKCKEIYEYIRPE